MSRHLVAITVASALAASCMVKKNPDTTIKEEWNAANNPTRLEANYVATFSKLPLDSKLQKRPWSDTYWPSKKGGIAARWQKWIFQRPSAGALPRPDRIQRMGPDEISELSPAEKFDIYMGAYDLPLTRMVLETQSRGSDSWEGSCHGWSPAALAFNEPHPVTLKSPHGAKLTVPFGSSDIKGLLAFLEGNPENPNFQLMAGEHCTRQSPAGCRDVNPGTLHIVMANEIALFKRGFIIDRDPGEQVWNQPVWGYKSTIRKDSKGASPGAAPGTVREVTIQTALYYADESAPSWEATNGTSGQQNSQMILNYRLELGAGADPGSDDDDVILGGTWLDNNHPDWVWRLDAAATNSFKAVIWIDYNGDGQRNDGSNGVQNELTLFDMAALRDIYQASVAPGRNP